MKQTFKTFLINEVKYEDGIDVEFDAHGRISGTVSPSSSGQKDLRSEFTAADEINNQMGQLSVDNKSEVPGYGGLYWQYFENLENIKTDSTSTLSITKIRHIYV